MSDYQGKIQTARGPFTYWVKEVENTSVNQALRPEYQVGPEMFLMQRDADGNDYKFAYISPLVPHADIKSVLKKLNRK